MGAKVRKFVVYSLWFVVMGVMMPILSFLLRKIKIYYPAAVLLSSPVASHSPMFAKQWKKFFDIKTKIPIDLILK
jgi:hypothetical protein